jgi:hypothetical protein
MPIETDFAFAHEVVSHAAPSPDFLGLLRGLVGKEPARKPRRIWKGAGFNMIWRPNFGNRSGTKDFFLELNFTDETLSFSEISGKTGIANRGLLQEDIVLGGVAYLQTVNDKFDGTGQHFEPGVWVNTPATTNPGEQSTIARMGSIPHGAVVNLQGRAFSAPKPQFDVASITPFRSGSPDDGKTNLVRFDEEKLEIASTSRTDLKRVAGLMQDHLANPNLFLSQAIANQTITSTVVLTVNSDTSAANSIPNIGGGTSNIAFLEGKGASPSGGPNAAAVSVKAIFWIEQVKDADGNEFVQLQYTQRVLLNFNGLNWPHISVATLRLD